MIRMIDLVEEKVNNFDKLHDSNQPYADSAEKTKQSKDSQDTMEKTTK